MQEFVSLATRLADEAGPIARQYFRTDFTIEQKQDATPVTIADKSVEQRLREIVEKERPEDGILGEEFGTKEGRNGLTWVFDPIDGTKSFMIGRPTFGTLIALCENGVPILGIIDQPILKERWIGVKGEPTTFNGRPIKTRACASLKEAIGGSTSPRQIPTLWPKMYDAFKGVVWGGDCYTYGVIACGWMDVSIETGLGKYDFAALPPIIHGAGGWIGDWNGNPLTLESKGDAIAVGDPALKDKLIAFIQG